MIWRLRMNVIDKSDFQECEGLQCCYLWDWVKWLTIKMDDLIDWVSKSIWREEDITYCTAWGLKDERNHT